MPMPSYDAVIAGIRGRRGRDPHRKTPAAYAVIQSILEEEISNGASGPDRAWLMGLVEHLDELAGVILASEDIGAAICELDEADLGTILLFDDGSFLRLENDLTVCRGDLHLDLEGEPLALALATVPDEEIIAATPAFEEIVGGFAEWLRSRETLSDESAPYGGLITRIGIEIEESLDPEVGDDDFVEDRNWSAGQTADLDAAILDVWLGMGIPTDVGVVVLSAFDDEPCEICLEFDRKGLVGWRVEQVFADLLGRLVNLNAYQGSVLEYNDGPSDRRSGYSEGPIQVTFSEVELSCQSNHQRLNGPTRLVSLLENTGMSAEAARDLVGSPGDFADEADAAA